MEGPHRFGAVVSQLLAPATDGRTPSTKPPALVAPTSLAEADALREWALSARTEPPRAASSDQIAKHLAFMAAALPSKAVDDLTGKMRFAVYTSLLGSYSNEALAYMARLACRTLDWFPTPRQCLDLIAGYRPPESDRETALRLCQDFTSGQFDRWLANLRDGQPVGDVPDQWKRIAVEQGVLRRMDGGEYVLRALYHGPFKPYQPALAA